MALKRNISIEVAINRATQKVAVTHVENGNPVVSCDFTVTEAANHIKHIQTAIDMLLGRGPGGLIMPDGIKVQ